jgi:hypothetical protein
MEKIVTHMAVTHVFDNMIHLIISKGIVCQDPDISNIFLIGDCILFICILGTLQM